MQAPSRGPVRLIRAGMLGAVSLLLATGAHRAGGGGLPELPVLAFLMLAAAPVALFVTDRQCRLPRVLIALGIDQVVLHAGLSVTAAGAGCGGTPAVIAAGHHAMVLTGVTCPAAAPAGVGHLSVVGMSNGAMASGPTAHLMGSWPMLGAHVVATLLTAVVFARGEAALWALVDLIVPRPLPSVLPLAAEGRPSSPPAAMFRPVVSRWATGTSPRGPPQRLAPGLA